jgi:hypothetical protein
MKKPKQSREAHSSGSRAGSGDYYGVGLKQPMGKMRSDYFNDIIDDKKIKKPPRSLA